MKKKILIIEDEPGLIFMLRDSLEMEGYKVLVGENGNRGIELALNERPDLILLDIMLPGCNGWEVCKTLRNRGVQAPLIMLTVKSQPSDKVLGFKLGADDYVTKPFSMMELLLRIDTRLRRTRVPTPEESTFRFADIFVDFRNMTADKDGRPLKLTAREFQILQFFIEQRGKVVTRDQLLSAVWECEAAYNTRTVDMHISKLRQKIEENPHDPQHIITVHWSGYKFLG